MSDTFRWQALFQHSREPLFVLDRRRRVIFANRASEALTGVSFEELRGLACTLRASVTDHAALGRTLAPPPEVAHGRTARLHRPPPPAETGPPWWELEYLPLAGEKGVLAILVRVRAGGVASPAPSRQLTESETALRDRAAERVRLDSLDGRFPAMLGVLAQARLAAASNCPVLIVGESGVGKRWLAHAIHCASAAASRPFLPLDAPNLPATAVNGVLFGPLGLYRNDGAGTIYIAEPSRLTLDVQDELAQRLAQADAGGPRLIAGTSDVADPARPVGGGTMLRALFDALSVLVIRIPALRDRPDDWPATLAIAFDRLGSPANPLSSEATECLRGYSWPGNWHELLSVLGDALTRTTSGRIDVADLPLPLRQVRAAAEFPAPTDHEMPALDSVLEQAERRLIVEALAKAKGNQSKAAEMLKIWRPRLIRRMKALGIEK